MPSRLLPQRIDRARKEPDPRTCPAHRAWVRRHHCCVPGCRQVPIECAHVRGGTDGGIGLKPSDKWVISLAIFAVDPFNPILNYTRYEFGTLPPGPYLRLSLTFLNANMACNDLTVSLMLLLAARRSLWIGRLPFILLLGGILIAAMATISPGLGGIALALCLWFWLVLRDQKPTAAWILLAFGTAVGIVFVAAMTVTPILHPTAPFLINVPRLNMTLAPAGRLMT